MSPIYDQIASNRRRTVVLIILFTLAVTFLGWALGQYTNTGEWATLAAVVFSILMSVFSFYAGDKVALLTAGAKGPLEKTQAPDLYRMVENLSIASGLPTPKIYLMEDEAINAFATGRDPNHASIAVTTGAVQKLQKTELEGVIAHELSHVKNFDTRYLLLVAVLVGALVLMASWFRRAVFFGGGRKNNDRNEGGNILLIVGIVFAILAPIFAQLIKLAISRQREYLADASGALLTRYPDGLASALAKIENDTHPLDHANEATAHLYFASPFGSKVGSRVSNLFSTHPPIEDRIKRLKEMTV